MWFFLVLLLIVVGLAAYAVSLYNGFVRSRNVIQESWRQIDVELNRRYDLIPNLVETTRAYATPLKGSPGCATRPLLWPRPVAARPPRSEPRWRNSSVEPCAS